MLLIPSCSVVSVSGRRTVIRTFSMFQVNVAVSKRESKRVDLSQSMQDTKLRQIGDTGYLSLVGKIVNDDQGHTNTN